jgi:hypothetical protein
MAEHPRLINRPVVRTPKGTRLCRPPETVLEIRSETEEGLSRLCTNDLIPSVPFSGYRQSVMPSRR